MPSKHTSEKRCVALFCIFSTLCCVYALLLASMYSTVSGMLNAQIVSYAYATMPSLL